MSFILVILTVAFFIAIELGRSRKSSHVVAAVPMRRSQSTAEIFERYFHPGHTWALVSNAKSVLVGSDEFSERMIGKAATIEFPHVGEFIHQGEPLAVFRNGNRMLPQVSPISGKVVEINQKLIDNPSLLNTSPLERGWIAKIVPVRLETELKNLMNGAIADNWREAVRMHFIQLFSPRLGILLQDGGQITDGLSEQIPDEEWNRIIREFFPVASLNHIQSTPMK